MLEILYMFFGTIWQEISYREAFPFSKEPSALEWQIYHCVKIFQTNGVEIYSELTFDVVQILPEVHAFADFQAYVSSHDGVLPNVYA